MRFSTGDGVSRHRETRKVDRPQYAQLVREVHAIGFCATGRRSGVSDNAIRKWIEAYEGEREQLDEAA